VIIAIVIVSIRYLDTLRRIVGSVRVRPLVDTMMVLIVLYRHQVRRQWDLFMMEVTVLITR